MFFWSFYDSFNSQTPKIVKAFNKRCFKCSEVWPAKSISFSIVSDKLKVMFLICSCSGLLAIFRHYFWSFCVGREVSFIKVSSIRMFRKTDVNTLRLSEKSSSLISSEMCFNKESLLSSKLDFSLTCLLCSYDS